MLHVKKARTGEDQRECLKYWHHNGTLITGCTTKIDPDGKEGKEWCKVSNPKAGEADWSYCTPSLDMDAVRQATSDFYEGDIKIMK